MKIMKKYNHRKIESKWQEYWAKNPKLFKADEKSKKSKFYCLDMFPYPSGDGLHVGHVEGYTASDIYSRYQRMKGKNVLHPMGWDAFGLPAENFAIRTGVHPAKSTQKNIKTFKKQIKSLGLSYDWSREIDTSSPEYYRWTQWFFLFLYKKGLAYRQKAKVNWCSSCQTVLANEQVENGVCERCKNEVIQKEMEQWFFRITDFAEDLIKGLDKIDWPESTKTAQRNWIGKSEGAKIKFKIQNPKSKKISLPTKVGFLSEDYFLEVFTTRLDTIFGCTYCVVAPEHSLIEKLKNQITNFKEVEKYITEAKKKTDLQRTDLAKEKTGVELKGIKAVNPFTQEAVPIFVADYVLSTYGTGAVMAVPAHDERDWEFAKKYGLPIRQSIAPDIEAYNKTANALRVLQNIYKSAEKEKVKIWILGGLGCAFHAGIIYRSHEDLDLIVKNNEDFKKALKIFEKLGFRKIKEKKLTDKLTNYVFTDKNGIEIDIGLNAGEWGLTKKDFEKDVKILNGCEAYVLSKKFHVKLKEFLRKRRNKEKDVLDLEYLKEKILVEDGFLVNSGKYSGLTSQKAREEMAKWLEKNKLGKKATIYKLRDWLISRQRYWGAPIPIIYCRKCWENSRFPIPNSKLKKKTADVAFIDGKEHAIVPVSEKNLPVLLPKVKDYRPRGTSPLGTNPNFVKVKCPVCKAEAKRETDTMDTFVCSSWYFFRFADPQNKKEFASPKKIKKWLPVDLYLGGAEHTVLHLLYSRFFTKVLQRYKYIDFDEPFRKLRHQGIVLAEDGRKMSKSLRNVINPDEIIRQYGADTLRLYEMFMGPLEDSKSWNTSSIIGLRRFLEKMWRLRTKIIKSKIQNPKLDTLLHKTIKKVTEDIENLRFNTAISAMMILVNELEKEKNIPIANYQLLITLLSPFAPHLAEEIWEKIGHKRSVFLEKWPEYNPVLIKEEEINLIVQVNGKVRDQIKASAGLGEKEARELALKSQKVKKYLKGQEIKKIVYIPDRLLNFVV
jgi:leucyl-tRNA synthetase